MPGEAHRSSTIVLSDEFFREVTTHSIPTDWKRRKRCPPRRRPTPQPDKLQMTLARISGLVGEENVGTPQLADTFRSDAFRFATLNCNSSDLI
jgi:hypothetical protein